jgi:hypothetical protein
MAFFRLKLKYGLGQEQAMQARLMGRGHPVCDFPSCKIKTFHGHEIKGNKTFSTPLMKSFSTTTTTSTLKLK